MKHNSNTPRGCISKTVTSAGYDNNRLAVVFSDAVRVGAMAPMAELAMLGRSEPWGMSELKLERGRLDNVFRAITAGASR